LNKPPRIICFGNSITHAQNYAEADRWTTHLAFHLEEAAPGAYEVFNRGIGGNTTSLALDRIQIDVIPLLPGSVLVEFGINDAYVTPWAKIPRVALPGYKENLLELIRQIQTANGQPVLLINHPLAYSLQLHTQGNQQSVGANLEPYNGAALEIARHAGIPIIDLPSFLKLEQMRMEEFWAEDGVHLSPAGNRLYARLVFAALRELRLIC